MAWVVLALPVIVMFMGLVLDFGLYMLRSQMLDAATDAAALAATEAWDRDYWMWHGKVRIDPAQATSLARGYLAKNMPSSRLVQVTVSPANRVNVRTETEVPFFFLRIIGWTERTVDSFSTAVRQECDVTVRGVRHLVGWAF